MYNSTITSPPGPDGVLVKVEEPCLRVILQGQRKPAGHDHLVGPGDRSSLRVQLQEVPGVRGAVVVANVMQRSSKFSLETKQRLSNLGGHRRVQKVVSGAVYNS